MELRNKYTHSYIFNIYKKYKYKKKTKHKLKSLLAKKKKKKILIFQHG